MAKLTQKQLIEQQSKEIEQLKQIISDKDTLIQKLNIEITKMTDNADNSFHNSSDYMQMQKRINILELKNKSLSDTVQHNLEIHNLKLHNERGAGRKARFTDMQIIEIKQYRAEGKTIKEIAEMYECSVGLIHKLISE
ncbi:Hin recombinase [Clostridium butyricum]|uniref:Hin recombinase n=1 Tax=Clostridium butyricum TaxID=1492 RepID=UPI001CA986DB|nr:Hin recombinase [Clostridium butyricum]MBZ0314756.1 Hin recombinase [Clostridium butyricum]